MILLVILFYAMIAVFELIPMIKNSRNSDQWIYVIGLSISFIIAILISFDIKLPSPSKQIKDIVMMLKGS